MTGDRPSKGGLSFFCRLTIDMARAIRYILIMETPARSLANENGSLFRIRRNCPRYG